MKRPTRQYFVVLPEGGKYPMKPWLRQHPDHIPQGMHPNTHVSQQLRNGLERNGWEVREADFEVHLIPSTKEREVDLETVIDLLREAMSVITPTGAWTQGTWARTASGKIARSSDRSAASFCILGALERSISNLNISDETLRHAYKIVHEEIRAADAIDRLLKPKNANHASSIIGYNDRQGRTQKEVLNVLDDAVFQAEMKEFEQHLFELDTTVNRAVEYVSSHAPKQHHLDSRGGHKPRRSRS